jgi:protein involved in polysaccharide export with SLBB domain
MQLINSKIMIGISACALSLSGAVAVPAFAQSTAGQVAGSSSLASAYKLGVSDRLSISVYGEDDLSREYIVSPAGTISMSLIGDIMAKGRTPNEVQAEILRRLSDGFLNKPTVTLSVTGFRNFYILGEVNRPGEFPYESGLTLTQAVAAASGFTYRAAKRYVFIRHEGEAQETKVALTPDMPVLPGDTIRLGERYF